MAGRRIDSLHHLTEALTSDPFGLLDDTEDYIDDAPPQPAPKKKPEQIPGGPVPLLVAQLKAILSASFEFGDVMLAETLDCIRRRMNPEEQQNQLVDLLGIHHFDLVADILQNKERLLMELNEGIKQQKAENRLKLSQGQSYCQQVTVKSERLRSEMRDTQRERKKANKAITKINHAFGDEAQLAIELQHLQTMKQLQAEFGDDDSVTPTTTTKQRKLAQRLPYVFDSMRTSSGAEIVCSGLKFCLPVGSERIDKPHYQEVVVPGKQNLDFNDFEYVEVKDLDPIGKLGFQGFEKLNVIQSIVFEQAYNSRENLLICAPTGAGKTNIAMLAALKTIRDYTSADGVVHKSRFKIIYIAPMKALATEMTESFSKRLKPLGLKVKELTGDTVLSKKEIEETQMLVLTPEKWDVVTRKATADENSLTQLVRLLIIDEVHLLHDERGPVIETLVARTLRQVEMSQREIRIVGLSATLPNYIDCAHFLRVNLEKGLFFFDSRFRPIPLTQKFVGIKKTNYMDRKKHMDDVCNEKVCDYVKRGKQVLIFVHSRNNTVNAAMALKDYASTHSMHDIFTNLEARRGFNFGKASKAINASQNAMLKTLFGYGIGIHHAGLLRQDRLLMEKMFAEGMISVLCCTATLAWGVNLPAHAVIIKGTEVFNQDKGAFSDIGILDVQQIFGRAGRPQFETHGEGIIITDQAVMPKYLGMLVNQTPIESQFMRKLHDNLNAEIALGTVTNINEAVEWLRYSYIYIRMRLNPTAYGIPFDQLKMDPDLVQYITMMMCQAAARLDKNKMVRYIESEGFLFSTDLGRIAAHFYITFETIEMLHDGEAKVKMMPKMTDDVVTALIASATEFKQIQCREEEMKELDELTCCACALPIRQGLATTTGKVNCLLQAHISRARVESFSLFSETNYVVQNATRLARAFFEIAMRRNWAHATNALLVMSKCIEKRLWPYQTPLRQLSILKQKTIEKIESRRLNLHQLYDMAASELGNMLSCDGKIVYDALRNLPVLEADATVRPITHTIMQVLVTVWPGFQWNDSVLGRTGGQSFWITVENAAENLIVHRERIFIQRKKIISGESQNFIFTIPVHDYQMKHQYQLRIASEYWVVDDTVFPLSMHNSVIPTAYSPHTDLLPLDPLSIKALKNPIYESLYSFKYLNPVQTQVFHCLYHSDSNVLVGAPTGSGKTLCAELAMYRVFNSCNENSRKKVVYIAPLKALVRERVLDWQKKLGENLGLKIVEVSGDRTPGMGELMAANVLITTPEKWDGITRSWETRDYVHDVALVVIDEIHLLGVERGAVIEAIITRLKVIERRRGQRLGLAGEGRSTGNVRIVGLSTALANAVDIADWLGVPEEGLFNFRPAVRPIPISVHIAGFPGQHYCPRMALMNKPAFKAIKTYSPKKPTLIFVSSRRQTRITATALVSQIATENDPKQWLHMDPEEIEMICDGIEDKALKLTLPFGIGMHHAGLQQHEKALVERLYVEKKIQILVATATLAWGINMPAHLVIIKGTEYFDGKQQKYVDFPVTDVLQMMGRAGRPQFDDSAVAVVYVQDTKKEFYKRFLYEPFPVESSLLAVLPNHVNAEICSGNIKNRQEVVEYLSGTYLYRRLFNNPAFYDVEDAEPETMIRFFTKEVDDVIHTLMNSQCVVYDEKEDVLKCTAAGRIASTYYLQHETVKHFMEAIEGNSDVVDLIAILADCPEYSEVPVRHNEELINEKLQKELPIKLGPHSSMEDAHTKTHLLYQAHFSRLTLDSDYKTDLRTIIEPCIRILQAMLEISIIKNHCSTALNVVILQQMIIQGRWHTDQPLLCLPHMTENGIASLQLGRASSRSVPLLISKLCDSKGAKDVHGSLQKFFHEKRLWDQTEISDISKALMHWPLITVRSGKLSYTGHSHKITLCPKTREQVHKAPALKLPSGTKCTVQFSLEMLGPGRGNTRVYSSAFTKEKSASWIVFVADVTADSVLVMKKMPPVEGVKRGEVSFIVPQPHERGNHSLDLIVMSDSYLNADVQCHLCDIVVEC